MDNIEIVKAYYAALDSANMEKISEYISEDYQLVDFTPQPMDKRSVLNMIGHFKAALPNLNHSLSNMQVEGNTVRVTVQLSGTNSGNLDLREMGIGVVPRSQKFIIFPNGTFEFTIQQGKITTIKDVSPISPNRRMPGMLKALGVNTAAL